MKKTTWHLVGLLLPICIGQQEPVDRTKVTEVKRLPSPRMTTLTANKKYPRHKQHQG